MNIVVSVSQWIMLMRKKVQTMNSTIKPSQSNWMKSKKKKGYTVDPDEIDNELIWTKENHLQGKQTDTSLGQIRNKHTHTHKRYVQVTNKKQKGKYT